MQIIMGSNKEAVVAEKRFSAHFGQKVLIGYSDVIHSGQFNSWEAFKAKVAEEWALQWDRIATADWSRAFPLLVNYLHHSAVTALLLFTDFRCLSVTLLFMISRWQLRDQCPAPSCQSVSRDVYLPCPPQSSLVMHLL